MLAWLIFFTGPEPYVPPQAGDVFTLKTLKPFPHKDVFEFSPKSYGNNGDVNGDGSINILDVVVVVRHFLGTEILVGDAFWRADCSGNNEIDVLDLVGIVNVILGIGECVP